MKNQASDIQRAKKYFISHSNKDSWKIFDWFEHDFYKLDRYERMPWEAQE